MAMKAEVAAFQRPAKPTDGKAVVYMVRPSALGGLVRVKVFLNARAGDVLFNLTGRHHVKTLTIGKVIKTDT